MTPKVRLFASILMAGLATVVAVGTLGGLAASTIQRAASTALADQQPSIGITFWGNMAFQMVSLNGVVVLTNPWIRGNPDAPLTVEDIQKADLMLVGAAHSDDMGNAIEIANNTGARVFASVELAGWMVSQGLPSTQAYGMAPGGNAEYMGIKLRMVRADHTSGIAGEAMPGYGGLASGYMITFENGLKVYFANDTGLMADMELFGRWYQPHVAILPIAGRYMMDPEDAAYAVKLLSTDNPNLRTVIPAHHRFAVPSPGGGTAEAFEEQVRAMGLPVSVLSMRPGESAELR